jgi:hypothetical protein
MLANAAMRGGGSGGAKQHACGGFQGNRGGGHHAGGGHMGNPNNPYKNHQCQVCGKFGHTTLHYWKRFDKNYSVPEKTANVASSSTSYNHDLVWYADSAATDHTTSDLDKLTMTENYAGPDQVHVANGAGMMIKHICHSIISTPCR